VGGRRMRGAQLAMLAALGVLLAGCGAGTIPAVHSEPERLALAQRSIQRGDYNVAVELLKSYVVNNSGGADVDMAVELLGESYLHLKEWSQAGIEFERLLRDYPESDSSAAAAFHLGQADWGQSRKADFDQEFTQKALDQWQGYLRDYPGHWLNAEAQRRVLEARTRLATKLEKTGELYLKLKKPGPARVYFQRVIDDYSDTPRVADARLGLALTEAAQGRRTEAIASLRELESSFSGQPLAQRAARERSRLERKKT
jgi:outer membrane protein assembly factor BamD